MFHEKFIKIVTSFLLVTMALVLVNIAFNGHIHQRADGCVVYHAHPYEKSDHNNPYAGHCHTEIKFLFHAFSTRLFELGFIFLFALFIFIIFEFLIPHYKHSIVTWLFNANLTIRGPPLSKKLRGNIMFSDAFAL